MQRPPNDKEKLAAQQAKIDYLNLIAQYRDMYGAALFNIELPNGQLFLVEKYNTNDLKKILALAISKYSSVVYSSQDFSSVKIPSNFKKNPPTEKLTLGGAFELALSKVKPQQKKIENESQVSQKQLHELLILDLILKSKIDPNRILWESDQEKPRPLILSEFNLAILEAFSKELYDENKKNGSLTEGQIKQIFARVRLRHEMQKAKAPPITLVERMVDSAPAPVTQAPVSKPKIEDPLKRAQRKFEEAKAAIIHSIHSHFDSIEGFYYWNSKLTGMFGGQPYIVPGRETGKVPEGIHKINALYTKYPVLNSNSDRDGFFNAVYSIAQERSDKQPGLFSKRDVDMDALYKELVDINATLKSVNKDDIKDLEEKTAALGRFQASFKHYHDQGRLLQISQENKP